MSASSLTDRRHPVKTTPCAPVVDSSPWRCPSKDSSSSISPRTSPGRSARRSSATWAPRSSRSSDPGRGDDARAWAPPFWGERERHVHGVQPQQAQPRPRPQARGRPRGAAPSRRPRRRLRAEPAAPAPSPSWDSTSPRPARSTRGSSTARSPPSARAARSRTLPGYDPLMQAYAGLMSVNGHPGQEPARVGTSIVDMGTGMWAALGIMAGLRQREATGRARGGDHRAVRDRADVGLVPRDGLPRQRRGPAAAGLGHRHDRALPGVRPPPTATR